MFQIFDITIKIWEELLLIGCIKAVSFNMTVLDRKGLISSRFIFRLCMTRNLIFAYLCKGFRL